MWALTGPSAVPDCASAPATRYSAAARRTAFGTALSTCSHDRLMPAAKWCAAIVSEMRDRRTMLRCRHGCSVLVDGVDERRRSRVCAARWSGPRCGAFAAEGVRSARSRRAGINRRTPIVWWRPESRRATCGAPTGVVLDPLKPVLRGRWAKVARQQGLSTGTEKCIAFGNRKVHHWVGA